MLNSVDQVLAKTNLEPELVKEILKIGRLKKVRTGQVVLVPALNQMKRLLSLNGLLKVIREDDQGNEMLLC